MKNRCFLRIGATLAAILVLLSGFSLIFWGYPKNTDGKRQNSRVTIEVQGEVTTKTEYIAFRIKNSSMRRYCFDPRDVLLETKENGNWTPKEKLLNEDHTTGNVTRFVKPFSEQEYQIYTPDYFLVAGALPAGEYRILQPLYTSEKNLARKRNAFYAVGYFSVTGVIQPAFDREKAALFGLSS